MLRIEVNTKKKAERIIFGMGKRVKSWRAYYNSFTDRETYLIWYEPLKTVSN